MDAYHTETIEHRGLTFRVSHHYDNHQGAPWAEYDGHGKVRKGSRTYDGYVVKSPGEVVLHDGGHRGGVWVYNFAGAVAKAKTEGWNVAPYTWNTEGERAHHAALADMAHLRDWCADRWHWCGVSVALLVPDEEGELIPYNGPLNGCTDSLWGIESDAESYLEEVAQEMADGIAATYLTEKEEAQAMAARGVLTTS